MDEQERWTFTRDELVEALKARPVTSVLLMLKSQRGCPGDLADAIIQALGRNQS